MGDEEQKNRPKLRFEEATHRWTMEKGEKLDEDRATQSG